MRISDTRKGGSLFVLIGAPERIRTSDTRLRKPVLYPAELRALTALLRAGSKNNAICSVGLWSKVTDLKAVSRDFQ